MNKGFTLVELLAVIVVIALLSLVVITPISGRLNKMSAKLDDATKDIIYTSLDDYIDSNSLTYRKINGNIYYISTNELVNNGVLDKTIVDDDFQIRVEIKNGECNYEFLDVLLKNIGTIWKNMSKPSTYSYENGTYLKGSVTNNYVMFSNMLWRIMGKNNDGSIRLILNEPISQLGFSGTSYEDSSVREWLNDYFLSRLQHENLIVSEKWYYNGNTYVTDKVGMLSSQEVQSSYFLTNMGNEYVIDALTGASSGNVRIIDHRKQVGQSSRDFLYYIRPVINIDQSSVIVDGYGMASEPYIIADALVNETNRTIKRSNIGIGSIVEINDQRYIVTEVLEDKIKIINDIERQDYGCAYNPDNGLFTLNTGIGKYLNELDISSIAVPSNIYIGSIYSVSDDYKTTIFSKKNMVSNVRVFLPKIGGLFNIPFSSQNSSSLTLANSDSIWNLDGIQDYKNESRVEIPYIELYISSDINITQYPNPTYPYVYYLDIAY